MNKQGAFLKKSKNIENMHARHAFLLEGLQSQDKVGKIDATSLAGQRVFAALSIPNSAVFPLSLNTVKSLANELYADKLEEYGNGFIYFDSLRIMLKKKLELDTVEKNSDAKSRRHTVQLEELENKLRAVEVQNILRTKAYIDLYGKLNALIKSGDMAEVTRLRLLSIIHSHNDVYSDLFSPQVVVGSEGSVLSIFRKSEAEDG